LRAKELLQRDSARVVAINTVLVGGYRGSNLGAVVACRQTVRRKHTVEPFEKEVCDALGALIADQDELAVAELAGNPRKTAPYLRQLRAR
jgi:hypothetical protein